ncbi:MAG: 50S ribosomal protein L9 [Gemmatimonadetes bacterium]|nr:50S ribosomal protein L9 [Gemmatimonadota bacterium]
MKVILRRPVGNLGEPGEVVEVKPGYARNYLLPQGLAYEATKGNLRRLEEEKRQADERDKRAYLEARRQASLIEGVSLTFHARAGEEGKLFGSVTNADIADRLNGQVEGANVDRRQVVLDEPLKTLGVFRVPIHLHAQVDMEVEVRIEREEVG